MHNVLMVKKLIFLFLLALLLPDMQEACCQPVDSSSFKIYSRYSFYSSEKEGELLLHVPPLMLQKILSVDIKVKDITISSWNGRTGKSILRLPIKITFTPGLYKIKMSIIVSANHGIKYLATTDLNILPYKSNEVKTDRLTGGLIVNKRQFFPFGFYTYSPVFPTLPEEEVVKGFNMIAPYQKILPETLNERKAYMDRCAQLGMKVHYNLLSVSGGGGVGSKIDGITDEDKKTRLIEEIKTFMNHPALLAWYISDEPTGNKIAPEVVDEIYKVVRDIDPWHPVSVVFMAPFLSSKKYRDGLDIVMADPYPLPDLPASLVGDVTGQLKEEFNGSRPVWIVPQAFGGGELWSREPTVQEMRSMTWQAIIKGATGIQYFVHQGLNYFPKSPATWSECGRIAMEVAELTPWLLSDEESLPVESNSDNILVSSRSHNGWLIVMAVNRTNAPASASIRIKGLSNNRARVLFENRTVTVSGGMISDYLAPFGSQVYLINIGQEKPVSATSVFNLIKDPGFEDLSSPGIPSACYARSGGDRGATFYIDSREHHEGNHSLRMITPVTGMSAVLRFFPIQVEADVTYTISLWAKSDPEQRFTAPTEGDNAGQNVKELMPQYVEILLGEYGRARFIPDKEWRQYVTFITIPADAPDSFKINLILKMPGQGVAWFDEIKVSEDVLSKR
jgi:hypothetical protein